TPVKGKNCVGCHNPHTAKAPGLLPQSGAALCFRCHTKEQKDFAKAFVHAPVKNGQCQRCHAPHA
ncbi:MAG: cytochrome C, partial [Anaerolineae bacterium]|nr:cytochrome C [Anaerolineae bacterium]